MASWGITHDRVTEGEKTWFLDCSVPYTSQYLLKVDDYSFIDSQRYPLKDKKGKVNPVSRQNIKQ